MGEQLWLQISEPTEKDKGKYAIEFFDGKGGLRRTVELSGQGSSTHTCIHTNIAICKLTKGSTKMFCLISCFQRMTMPLQNSRDLSKSLKEVALVGTSHLQYRCDPLNLQCLTNLPSIHFPLSFFELLLSELQPLQKEVSTHIHAHTQKVICRSHMQRGQMSYNICLCTKWLI